LLSFYTSAQTVERHKNQQDWYIPLSSLTLKKAYLSAPFHFYTAGQWRFKGAQTYKAPRYEKTLSRPEANHFIHFLKEPI